MTDNSRDSAGPNGRATDILIALAAGLVIGAVGALLLAPASGRDTRRRIGDLADEVAGRTGRMARRAGDTLKGQAERVEQAVAEGKRAYRQGSDNTPS